MSKDFMTRARARDQSQRNAARLRAWWQRYQEATGHLPPSAGQAEAEWMSKTYRLIALARFKRETSPPLT